MPIWDPDLRPLAEGSPNISTLGFSLDIETEEVLGLGDRKVEKEGA